MREIISCDVPLFQRYMPRALEQALPFVECDQQPGMVRSSWMSPVLNQLEQDASGGGSIVVRAAAASGGAPDFLAPGRVLQIERWAQCGGRHLGTARRGSNLEHVGQWRHLMSRRS